jgi:hypothetical protein
MSAIRLASYVNASQAYDWGCYARLDLDGEAARRLLAWRDVYHVAAGACDVWAVRVVDYRVRFYSQGPEEPWCYKLDADWWRMAEDLEDFGDGHLLNDDIQTAEVDSTGIHWHTYVNDDIPIETCSISWAQLEEVAAGHDPFEGGERCDFCNSALGPLECLAGEVYYCRDNPRCVKAAEEVASERGSLPASTSATVTSQDRSGGELTAPVELERIDGQGP